MITSTVTTSSFLYTCCAEQMQTSSMAAQEFYRVIRRLGLSTKSAVAVGVSGGSDSLALTLLARQLFDRVVGITVDHRLRKESSVDAVKTGELVKQLGVEHHIVSLDWDNEADLPTTNSKIQLAAHNKRFPALLGLCEKLDIRTLMLAHNLDDQNETFLLRMAKGSGIEGLGGMYPVTTWPGFPRVDIMRPLLGMRKTELQDVCRSEGVEWIEDLSNQSSDFVRNNIQKTLSESEELASGIAQLTDTCQEARNILQHQVNQALKKVHLSVNERYGYATVNADALFSLPLSVGKRVLQSLILHIGGARVQVHYNSMTRVYSSLQKNRTLAQQICQCILYSPAGCEDTLVIGRSLPEKKKQVSPIPVSVGETVHWDGRWKITIKRIKGLYMEKDGLYIRHMRPSDWGVAQRGVRKIRSARLPDAYVRGGLPVVTNENGYIILAPHFKVIDQSYGVDCDVKFEPLLPLTQLHVA